MVFDISVVVSIVFLLIAAFSIPFLLQIWRTTKSITETLHMLNQSLPGILRNLEEITANINKATHAVNEQIDGLSVVATAHSGSTGNCHGHRKSFARRYRPSCVQDAEKYDRRGNGCESVSEGVAIFT